MKISRELRIAHSNGPCYTPLLAWGWDCMQEQTPNGIIRFSDFEADLRRGELRKHGLRLKLQDQPFKILAALLENPGEVVSREELRQRIWGADTFVDFNRGLSSAVNRLRDALGDTAESPRYIETVARKGYRFIAPIESTVPPAPPQATPRSIWPLAAAAVAAAVCLAGVGLWLTQRATLPRAPRLDQMTTLIGSETMPSFSPDGRQLAFVWNGDKETNSDIYIQAVGAAMPQQLTNHPGADLLPSWSPTGRDIAFVRIQGTTSIYLTSPSGGPERRLLELPGLDGRPPGPETRIVGDLLYPTVSRLSWTPDGKFIAYVRNNEPPLPGDGAVYLLPANGGAPRPMLQPHPGGRYGHPVFSPDGKSLAVIACVTEAGNRQRCDLVVQPLAPDLQPAGAPQTLLGEGKAGGLRGVAWAPDGKSLIVSGFILPRFYLWRIPLAPNAPPQRIEMAGVDAMWPAVAGPRLAFTHSILQADLWRLDLGSKPAPFLSSTARDTEPAGSPDGRRIAFQSGRGGANDIWVAQTDGSGQLQLTRNQGRSAGSPAWSPDGRWLAFDSIGANNNRADVWVVASDGGTPRQVTDGPGNKVVPHWSRDGKSLYYTSAVSGRPEVWRISALGGRAERVTSQGGFAALESWDGRILYYTKSDAGSEGLFEMPLPAGRETRLTADPVVRRSFDAVREGIYYITPRDAEWCELRFLDIASGRAKAIAPIQRPVAFGLSVSPDQRSFIFSRPVTGADLMMIDNFR